MKKLFVIWMIFALLLPCAMAESAGIAFTSLHGRYEITLPQGSVQYEIREIANNFGSGPATLRIREVDCYGFTADGELNLETASKPYTGLFRSDMEADPDSVVQSCIGSYTRQGYAEETLDIRYEIIGGRPFVSIHMVGDPYGTGEYYTYSTTGTQHYFAFYNVDDELERDILATLRLNEPTSAALDTTTLTAQAESYQNSAAGFITLENAVPVTSNTGDFTLMLPEDALHFTTEEAAELLQTNTATLNYFRSDLFRIFSETEYDLHTYVNRSGAFTAKDMETHPEDVIQNVAALSAPYNRSGLPLQCEIVNIAGHNFVRAHYSHYNPANTTSDYYTYDEGGTEYLFCFYDTNFEQEYSVLQSLQPAETTASDASGLIKSATSAMSTSGSSLANKVRDRVGNKTPAAQMDNKVFTSVTDRYTIELPARTNQRTVEEIAEFSGDSELMIRMMGMDEYSAFDPMYIDIQSYITEDSGYTADDLLKDPDAVFEYLTWIFLKYQNVEHADDIEWSCIDINGRNFALAEYTANDNCHTLDFFLYDERGTEFNFVFYDVSREDALAALGTLQLIEQDHKETSGKSPIRGSLNRLPTPSAREDAADTAPAYTIALPAGIVRMPSAFEEFTMNSVKSEASTDFSIDYFERFESVQIYSMPVSTKAITIDTLHSPYDTRDALQQDSAIFVDKVHQMFVNDEIDPDRMHVRFETIGNEHYCVYSGDGYEFYTIGFITVGPDGKQYEFDFANFTDEEAYSVMETLRWTTNVKEEPMTEDDGEMLTKIVKDDRYTIEVPAILFNINPIDRIEMHVEALMLLSGKGIDNALSHLLESDSDCRMLYSPLSDRGIVIFATPEPECTREEILSGAHLTPIYSTSLLLPLAGEATYDSGSSTIAGLEARYCHMNLYGTMQSCYCLVDDDGCAYTITICGFTPEQADAVMETFTLK